MAQATINNGESGLVVRGKINDNFTELYTGKDAVTVNTFADLPAPATVPQQKYWVLTATGVFLINRRSKGAYYSDGAAWNYLGDFPTTADQIGNVPAGGIAATDVQAALNELDTDKQNAGSFASDTRAQIEAALIAGANITITPSGAGATRQFTVASTGGGGGGLTQSQILKRTLGC